MVQNPEKVLILKLSGKWKLRPPCDVHLAERPNLSSARAHGLNGGAAGTPTLCCGNVTPCSRFGKFLQGS